MTFKIVVDSWKFTILLQYILWDDWPIFIISASNEQQQQQLEYTLLKPDCNSWWISKMQSDTLEERYAIKLCFKLEKCATETYGIPQTIFGPSYINRASFLTGIRDSKKAGILWGMMRGVGGVIKSIDQSWLAKGFGLGLLCWGFKGVPWHFQQENVPVHNSILVTDYLTNMGINTVHHPPYSPDLPSCDFWLFPKIRGCRYERIEEMKEAVTNVIDTLKQEDFHGAFEKLLER